MKDISRYISDTDRNVIEKVGTLFKEVDLAVQQFQNLTGIRCPDGCGECCSRSRVETTIIELMPLALQIWSSQTAEYWLARIHEAANDPVCVFYNTQIDIPSRGRCMIYPMRPLICRLFGFFTVRNKYGKYAYGSCREIKHKYPEVYEKAVRTLDEIKHPSVCTDYSIQVIGIDSMIGNILLPINQAALLSREKIGYRLECADWDSSICAADVLSEAYSHE